MEVVDGGGEGNGNGHGNGLEGGHVETGIKVQDGVNNVNENMKKMEGTGGDGGAARKRQEEAEGRKGGGDGGGAAAAPAATAAIPPETMTAFKEAFKSVGFAKLAPPPAHTSTQSALKQDFYIQKYEVVLGRVSKTSNVDVVLGTLILQSALPLSLSLSFSLSFFLLSLS